MLVRIPVFAAAACLATSAIAQQRLAPVREPYDAISAGYQADIKRAFREAFAPGVRLRAIVTPSFQLEYVVGLRQQDDRNEIFMLRPASRQIWDYATIARLRSGHGGVLTGNLLDPNAELRDVTQDEIKRLEEGLPADPGDLPLTRCAVAIDPALATVLQAVWRRMLDEVRPGERLEGGADGTAYRFSMELDGRSRSGETWSPERGTRMARLVRIAEAMREYCETRQAARLQELSRLTRQLGGER